MIKVNKNQIPEISGAGGGKKSGGAGSADNTLQSVATARIVEAISEGPIVGLVHSDDPGKSIYLDETPIVGLDGNINFDNVIYTERKGLPDDEHIKGTAGVETLNSVETEVTTTTGPVTRTITNSNSDAVRVMIRIDSLFNVDDAGQAQVADLRYTIEMRPFGGSWELMVDHDLVGEKASSPVQIAHRFDLPPNGAPWDIRVTKVTTDSTEDTQQINMTFEHFTTLVEGRFTYPHTALVGLEVEAESIGESVPERSYMIKGRIIDVPDNYDPETRVYTGMWTGVFKQAWTNNPAWIFYDLLTNDRYGLGEFINDSEVANLKWQLYTIGQYCDQEVPSGFKNDAAEDIMEPRFQFNGVIRNRQDAYHSLQSITTSFRGMGYWALGQIFATADMPADPIKLATPANVIDGAFNYSSTALKARHTVALVRWNDPNDFFRSATELVVDNEALHKYGWREKRVDMLGCTSRGLAHRYGKWILDVENNETETVEYKCGFDHMDIAPGNIIAVQDPRKANIRLSGRIVSHQGFDATEDVVVLDAETALDDQVTNKIYLTTPDGSLVEKDITYIDSDQKTIRINRFTDPLTRAGTDSVFMITAPDVSPRQYRVISINETDENVFQVTALFHDPNKYARVEQGINLEPISYKKENAASSPTALSVQEIAYVEDGLPKNKVRLSWVAPAGMIVRDYAIQMKSPTEAKKFITNTKDITVDIEGLERGSYIFYVTAIGRTGKVASPAQISYNVVSTDPIATGVVADLGLADNSGSEFQGRDVRIVWKNLFPAKAGDTPDSELTAMYDYNIVKVFDETTNSLLREVRVRGQAYTYSFDFNLRDSAATSLSVAATRNLRFEVQVVSKRNITSIAQIFNAVNLVPNAFSPTISVDGKNLLISTPSGVDTDLRGVKIWVEDNSDFDHLVETPVYDGPISAVTFSGEYAETYYVKAGYYDYFDDTVVVSPAVSATADSSTVGTPPSTPTGLSLTTSALTASQSRVTATWNANPEPSLSHYELLVSENSGNKVGFTTSTNEFRFDVLPAIVVGVEVRAVNASGAKSGYTAVETITAERDTVPPAVPANVTVIPGFQSFWIDWDEVTDVDLSFYEVVDQASATTPGASPNISVVSQSNSAFISGFDDDETRNFFVRAVDTSGNRSVWSAVVNSTTNDPALTQITAADIEGIVQATSFASGLEPVTVVTDALPSVKTTETLVYNGKLYKWNSIGEEYSEKVPTSDLSGVITNVQIGPNSVTAANIAAGAVGADQIAANAITSKKLAIGDFQNYFSGSSGDWSNNPWTLQSNASITTNMPRTGSHSLELAPTSSTRGLNFTQQIEVQEGDKFYVEYWVYIGNNFHGTDNSKFRINDSDDFSHLYSLPYNAVPAETWTKVTGEFTIPSGTTRISAKMWSDDDVGTVYIDDIVMRRKSGAVLIEDGAINSDHIGTNEIIANTANIANGVINNAKIANGTIENAKISDATITTAKINSIDSGKIVISGATTLADWKADGDVTKIDGGAVSANTISANKLTIGSRGLNLRNITFSSSGNTVSWTSGHILYVNDTGASQSTAISANSVTWTSGTRYIYWTKGSSTLDTTTSYSAAQSSTRVILATYQGGSSLSTDYGRTIIDGDFIKTNAIQAAHISAQTITSNELATNSIISSKIASGSVTTDKLTIGTGSNILQSPDPAQGLLHMFKSGSGDLNNGTLSIRPPGSYSGTSYPTYQISRGGSVTSSGFLDMRFAPHDSDGNALLGGYPVQEDQRYEFTAQCSVHRSLIQAFILWYEADGTYITETSLFNPTAGFVSDSSNPELWPRYGGFAVAPTDAAFAVPIFRINEQTSGTSCFLIVHKPMFAKTVPNATEFQEFSNVGQTVIDGSGILTNSITAGMGVFSGPLGSDNFVSGSSGWQINRNGNAEFNNVIIRRQIEVDSGLVSLSGFVPSPVGTGPLESSTWARVGHTVFVDVTNIPITAWAGTNRTYMATVEHVSGGVTASSANASAGDVYWGWTAEVLPLTRWQNPQTLRLKIEYWNRNVQSQNACQIRWRIYEVS